jgi:hypothetical protein
MPLQDVEEPASPAKGDDALSGCYDLKESGGGAADAGDVSRAHQSAAEDWTVINKVRQSRQALLGVF